VDNFKAQADWPYLYHENYSLKCYKWMSEKQIDDYLRKNKWGNEVDFEHKVKIGKEYYFRIKQEGSIKIKQDTKVSKSTPRIVSKAPAAKNAARKNAPFNGLGLLVVAISVFGAFGGNNNKRRISSKALYDFVRELRVVHPALALKLKVYADGLKVLEDYLAKSGKIKGPPVVAYYNTETKQITFNLSNKEAVRILEEAGFTFAQAEAIWKEAEKHEQIHQENPTIEDEKQIFKLQFSFFPEDISNLPQRIRTEKEDKVLSFIAEINYRAVLLLDSSSEHSDFVFVDLLFADRLLANMTPCHKTALDIEGLYKEMIHYNVLSEKESNQGKELAEILTGHHRQLGNAQARFNSLRKKTPITPEIRQKIRVDGFSVKGIANMREKVVHGKIVKYKDSSFKETLAYPLFYTVKELEAEIAALKEAVEAAVKESKENAVNIYLKEALETAVSLAKRTGYAPISHFLSLVIEKLRALVGEGKEIRMINTLQSAAQSVSRKIYPYTYEKMLSKEEMMPQNKTEEDLIDISNQLLAVYKEEAIEAKIKGDKDRKDMANLSTLFLEDILATTFLMIRKRGYSVTEAIFRAAQPTVTEAVTPARTRFNKNARDIAAITMELLRRLETDTAKKQKIILTDAPLKEEFILFLYTDNLELADYKFLRKTYTNMVGLVIKTGLKHYGITARQGGFPILTEAYTDIDGNRISTWEAIEGGETAILDANTSTLKVNPNFNELAEARKEEISEQAVEEYVDNRVLESVKTKDGVALEMVVNIDSYKEADKLNSLGVDKVGLYRSEQECASRGLISEEGWVKKLTYIIKRGKLTWLVLRLLDRKINAIGGDNKNIIEFGESSLEGLDFLIKDSIGIGIALTLIRAAMRVYAKSKVVGIEFPMINDLEGWQSARALVEQARESLIEEGLVTEEDLAGFKVGLMFETPSSVLEREELMARADFGSIGTNDLISLLRGLSRGAEGSTEYMIEARPDILVTIQQLINSAKERKIPLCVCGMLASELDFILFAAFNSANGAALKISVGIDEVASVKEFIRHIDTRTLKTVFEGLTLETDIVTFKNILGKEKERIKSEIREASKANLTHTTPKDASTSRTTINCNAWSVLLLAGKVGLVIGGLSFMGWLIYKAFKAYQARKHNQSRAPPSDLRNKNNWKRATIFAALFFIIWELVAVPFINLKLDNDYRKAFNQIVDLDNYAKPDYSLSALAAKTHLLGEAYADNKAEET
ncbi:MAG: hypothetical protein M0R66_09935, partial [Candidatus Omnitrophica bacterium]|nr:hypothetical protein [Candidatus Omnitrophota bacterium]